MGLEEYFTPDEDLIEAASLLVDDLINHLEEIGANRDEIKGVIGALSVDLSEYWAEMDAQILEAESWRPVDDEEE